MHFGGRSAHTLFDYVSTRWSEWLEVLAYVTANRVAVSDFIDLERKRYEEK